MKFPDLPTFAASWWPVFMETVPGGGERLTVGIVVREAATGRASVRGVIAPGLFTAMFGPQAGRGVLAMVSTTLVAMQRQLDDGKPPAAVELPYGGFHLGTEHDGVARDASEMFDIGVRMSSALALSPFGLRVDEVDSNSQQAFDDWAERVRAELLAQPAHVAWESEHFNAPVRIGRKQLRFGVLRGSYAANLGVLRPGHTSGDARSLKAKVFDLEALRRDQPMLVRHVELLVGCPPPNSMGAFTRRELDSYLQSLEFIATEARARQVALHECHDVRDAAHQIARLAA